MPAIEQSELTRLLCDILEPTRHDRTVDADMSWVVPMVKDTLFEQTVIHRRGNQTKAAEMLGIHRGRLGERLREIQKERAHVAKQTIVNDAKDGE